MRNQKAPSPAHRSDDGGAQRNVGFGGRDDQENNETRTNSQAKSHHKNSKQRTKPQAFQVRQFTVTSGRVTIGLVTQYESHVFRAFVRSPQEEQSGLPPAFVLHLGDFTSVKLAAAAISDEAVRALKGGGA
jgi:hypothetical protein